MRAQSLNAHAIAVAERHALWQRVLLYPAAQRREVIRRTVAESEDPSRIANEMQMPVSDVRAIADAFTGVPHRLS
jgi:hypothetical protein